MRLLLLTQWFPPEPQKLLLELAMTLKEIGHEVTVLTGLPNYPTGELYPGYEVKWVQEEVIEGIRVIRVPLFPDHSRNPFKRAANFLSFGFAAAVLGPFVIPRVDAIHVIHPPLTIGLAAWAISCAHRVPFTYEIQDMWPETLEATGMVRQPAILRLVGVFAKWVYAQSSAIRVISPGFRRNLIGKGVSAAKVRFISNWVDSDFYRPIDRDPALAAELGFSGKFVIVYGGTIGPAQGLDCLVDAAELLRDREDLLFAVFGEGIDRIELDQEVNRRKLTNIRFYGFQQPSTMPAIFANADALIIHLNENPLFEITIPHKTFVYMASGKPILAAVKGDVATVVSQASAGIACPPASPNRLAEAVVELMDLKPSEREIMGKNGRHAAESTYGRVELISELAAMTKATTQGFRDPDDPLTRKLV